MYINDSNFELTPSLEKMLKSIDSVDAGGYSLKLVELEAIVRDCKHDLFTVAVKAFSLGFLRGQISIKRKKQTSNGSKGGDAHAS